MTTDDSTIETIPPSGARIIAEAIVAHALWPDTEDEPMDAIARSRKILNHEDDEFFLVVVVAPEIEGTNLYAIRPIAGGDDVDTVRLRSSVVAA